MRIYMVLCVGLGMPVMFEIDSVLVLLPWLNVPIKFNFM